MPAEKPIILCVDDEQPVLDALTRLLRQDFKVVTAKSGQEGLQALKQNPDCSIILSDYRMPGMTGVEFLRAAQKSHPTTVRAILSGQMDIPELAEAINMAQIHRFILKPWDNEYLKLQMLEALQTHTSLNEKRELRYLSITDPVTGLTNHRYFQDRLSKELKRCQKSGLPLSLIMIDVDHFKSYNDHYGHPEGDRLLLEIADRLTKNLSHKQSVSRYGGEEFALVAPEVDRKEALKLAEQLRRAIEDSPFSGPFSRPSYVTVSVGVATAPDHADTPGDLLEQSDQALYEAKRKGRNQVASC